jgi:hypothetical protein
MRSEHMSKLRSQSNSAGPAGAKQPSPGSKSYDTSAHSNAAHGKSGEAVGKVGSQEPMHYTTKTFAEGATSQPVAGIPRGPNDVGFAEHTSVFGYPRTPHSFSPPAAQNAHGYGHAAHVRQGALRNSGHSNAHRIGKRSK